MRRNERAPQGQKLTSHVKALQEADATTINKEKLSGVPRKTDGQPPGGECLERALRSHGGEVSLKLKASK